MQRPRLPRTDRERRSVDGAGLVGHAVLLPTGRASIKILFVIRAQVLHEDNLLPYGGEDGFEVPETVEVGLTQVFVVISVLAASYSEESAVASIAVLDDVHVAVPLIELGVVQEAANELEAVDAELLTRLGNEVTDEVRVGCTEGTVGDAEGHLNS